MSSRKYYANNKEARKELARKYYIEQFYVEDLDAPKDVYTHATCNAHFRTAAEAYVHLKQNNCSDLLRILF